MATTIASLLIKIGIEVKEMNKGMKNVRDNLKKSEKGLGVFGAAFKRVGGIVALGLIGKKIFKETATFQEALSKLGSATNTTGADLKALGQEAIKLSNQFGVSTEEILHGMQTLKNLGLTTAETLEVLPNILKTVIGVGADFETTAAVMETVLNDFNLTAKDSAHITDVLIEAMRQGNFDIQAWREALKEAGSAAEAANAKFEDVAAALLILGKAGITGGRAGTALRNIFIGLNDQISKGAPLFRKYGMNIQNADGTFKSFAEIISIIQQRFKDLTPAQQTAFTKALAGKEAYSALNTIIRRTPESFEKVSEAMKKTGEQTEKTSKAQLNTLEGQMNRSKAIISNFAKDTEGTLSSWATAGLKIFNDFMEDGQKEFNELTEGIKKKFGEHVKIVSNAWNRIKKEFSASLSNIKNQTSAKIDEIKSSFNSFISGAYKWGADMFRNFGNGIVAGFRYVKQKVIDAANWVKSKLGFSKPDSGPLRDADTWMPDFMKLLATGIEMGIPKLQMAVGDVAATMADVQNVQGISNNPVVNNNVNVYPRHATLDARGLNRELERMRFLNGGMF